MSNHFLLPFTFVEFLEAVVWAIPSDDAQMNTALLIGDGCLSIWAESAPSLVSKKLGSDHSRHHPQVFGCFTSSSLPLDGLSFFFPPWISASATSSLNVLSILCFFCAHFGILVIQQPPIVDGYISHLPKEAHVPLMGFYRGVVQKSLSISKVNSSHVGIVL